MINKWDVGKSIFQKDHQGEKLRINLARRSNLQLVSYITSIFPFHYQVIFMLFFCLFRFWRQISKIWKKDVGVILLKSQKTDCLSIHFWYRSYLVVLSKILRAIMRVVDRQMQYWTSSSPFSNSVWTQVGNSLILRPPHSIILSKWILWLTLIGDFFTDSSTTSKRHRWWEMSSLIQWEPKPLSTVCSFILQAWRECSKIYKDNKWCKMLQTNKDFRQFKEVNRWWWMGN